MEWQGKDIEDGPIFPASRIAFCESEHTAPIRRPVQSYMHKLYVLTGGLSYAVSKAIEAAMKRWHAAHRLRED